MKEQEKLLLTKTAYNIRIGVVEAVYAAQSGHPGGSLSASDLLTYLYTKEMRIDCKNPKDKKRDRFVLSKGHCSPGLYATLAEVGFFDKESLKTFRHIDSFLQGHPNMKSVPGVDMSTGSLGQGVSVACGMAKGLKIKKEESRVYTLLGDGEIQEGQVWEAFMFAAHNKLDNLCIVIDNNGLQIDGDISQVMSPYPIDEKLKAFGIEVVLVDGHNFNELEKAFGIAKATKDKPTVIIMKTLKGKGVSFMENNANWHGKAPNEAEYKQAIEELLTAQNAMEV